MDVNKVKLNLVYIDAMRDSLSNLDFSEDAGSSDEVVLQIGELSRQLDYARAKYQQEIYRLENENVGKESS